MYLVDPTKRKATIRLEASVGPHVHHRLLPNRSLGKETVWGRNLGRALDVSRGMTPSGERHASGERVYLSREVRASGQIHAIGTRAHVLADHGPVIVLHLDTSSAEVVTCPTDHVARAVDGAARPTMPRAATPRLRPSFG